MLVTRNAKHSLFGPNVFWFQALLQAHDLYDLIGHSPGKWFDVFKRNVRKTMIGRKAMLPVFCLGDQLEDPIRVSYQLGKLL